MSMTVRELVNKVGFDLDESGLRKIEDRLSSVEQRMMAFGKKATLFITTPLLAAGGVMLKMAGEAVNLQDSFNRVFRGLEDRANEFSSNFAKDFRRADVTIQESMIAFMGFFKGLEAGEEQAFDFTKRLQHLMVDFGSFNNLTDRETLTKFVSAMAGSPMVLRSYGININQAATEQALFALGINKSVTEATELEKAMARLHIIERVMGDTGMIGDGADNLDEFASRMRLIGEMARRLSLSFGSILIGPANRILGMLFSGVEYLDNLNTETKTLLLIIAGVAGAIGPIAIIVALFLKFAVFFLKFLKPFMTAMKLWKAGKIIAGLKAVGVIAVAKIGAIVGIVLLLISAVTLLIEDFYIWTQGGKSLVDSLLGSFEKFKDFFLPFIIGLRDVVSDIGSNIVKFIKGFLQIIFGLFTLNSDMLINGIKNLKTGIFRTVYHILELLSLFFLQISNLAWAFLVKISEFIPEVLWPAFKSFTSELWSRGTTFIQNFLMYIAAQVKKIPGMIRDEVLGGLGRVAGFLGIGVDAGKTEQDRERLYKDSLQNQAVQGLSQQGAETRQNFDIDLDVNIDMPPGAPEDQIEYVKKAAQTSFRLEFDREIRHLMAESF